MLRLILAVCVTSTSVQAADKGLIGSVYAASYGQLFGAQIEVTDEVDSSKRFGAVTDNEGIFRFPDLPQGRYTVRVERVGFNKATVNGVLLLAGLLKDIGSIALIAECQNSQNGVCIGGPMLVSTDASGKIDMGSICSVDLDEQNPWCIRSLPTQTPVVPSGDGSTDLWFQATEQGDYLTPFKGVSFSVNPSTVTYERGCPNATYTTDPIRIDNLPPGSRVCVHTTRGGYAELRLPAKIALNQQEILVDFIAWPR